MTFCKSCQKRDCQRIDHCVYTEFFKICKISRINDDFRVFDGNDFISKDPNKLNHRKIQSNHQLVDHPLCLMKQMIMVLHLVAIPSDIAVKARSLCHLMALQSISWPSSYLSVPKIQKSRASQLLPSKIMQAAAR